MGADLVSVIVPVYNHAAYIESALASIATQTHGSIELVVLDDCSRDESFAKAAAFLERSELASRFENVIIQKNESNLGAAATLNAGLRQAKGEWLTILNSDDNYHPRRLELMLATLKSSGKRHGFSNLRLVDSAGSPIIRHKFALQFLCMAEQIDTCGIGFAILKENIAFTSGNLFFHKVLYEKIGGFIDLKLSHDWDYLIRLLAIEEPAFIPESLYDYRLHDSNTHSRVKFSEAFDPIVVYARYFRTLASGNYENPLFPLYQTRENASRLRKFESIAGKEPLDFSRFIAEFPETAWQRPETAS